MHWKHALAPPEHECTGSTACWARLNGEHTVHCLGTLPHDPTTTPTPNRKVTQRASGPTTARILRPSRAASSAGKARPRYLAKEVRGKGQPAMLPSGLNGNGVLAHQGQSCFASAPTPANCPSTESLALRSGSRDTESDTVRAPLS